ncbi:leucyl aminopeptidase family protein [Paenibacillus macerans]|uniref:M17 family metallopeptidase n=1 Tax=Paenibacillus macerans TaxID=44252 RepID=UPI0025594C33
MQITIDTGNRRAEETLVCPAYEGEPFALPLRDKYKHRGAATWLYARQDGEADVFAVGLGQRGSETLEAVRRAGGTAARALLREGRAAAVLVRGASGALGSPVLAFHTAAAGSGTAPVLKHAATSAAATAATSAAWLQSWLEGWLLGLYRFDTYRGLTRSDASVELIVRPADWPELSLRQLEDTRETARIRAEGAMLARDLVNEPPDVLNPERFAARVQSHFAGTPVRIRVYKGQELADREMNGLLAVGAGSKQAPALIELLYEGGSPDLPLLALVGKGVTFDMGGMNVKTVRDISDARMDMGGAAAVIGALDILVRQRAAVRVAALIAVADNLPDARAMLPSSVIRYPNGLTVQVANTDGEGRLILADALLHAAKLGAAEAIDIATLTGNVGQALGLGIAAILGDDGMSRALVDIGELNGERLWPMPLMDEYEAELRSDYADLRNVGTSGMAGAILAALFIRKFVDPSMKWVHIDMAGTVQYKQEVSYSAAGATGYGARLLADYAMRRFSPGAQ